MCCAPNGATAYTSSVNSFSRMQPNGTEQSSVFLCAVDQTAQSHVRKAVNYFY
jgi:hypothetical protein